MIVAEINEFINEVNEKRLAYYSEMFKENAVDQYQPIFADGGKKYLKLVYGNSGGTVWGFIALTETKIGGVPVKEGDLLKPAGYNAPAKHSRGNILDGSAKWGIYGPAYL